MKKITDSAIFMRVVNNQGVMDGIKNINTSKDAVTLKLLSEPLGIIEKKMIGPTKSSIMEGIKSKEIVIIYNKTLALPKYLNTIVKMENNKLISTVNITSFIGSYNENTGITIYPKTLYTLLQNGFITRELVTNWNKYTNKVSIIKNLSIAYSKLFIKILDKLFAINLDDFNSDLVSYLVSKFFLINMADKVDNEVISDLAYFSCNNSSSLNLIKEQELTFTSNKFDNIITLCENIRDVRGLNSLSVRTFTENWARMYGEPSLLAIDYFPAFMSMVYGSTLGGNLYKDTIIMNIAGKWINASFTEFARCL